MFTQQVGTGGDSQDLGDGSEGTIARDHPMFPDMLHVIPRCFCRTCTGSKHPLHTHPTVQLQESGTNKVDRISRISRRNNYVSGCSQL